MSLNESRWVSMSADWSLWVSMSLDKLSLYKSWWVSTSLWVKIISSLMRGSMRRWLLRAHIPLSIRSSSSLPPWCRKIRRRSRVIRHPHPTSMVALLNFQTVRYFASRRFGMPFLIWRYRHPSYYLKNRVQPRQGGKNSWKPYDMVQYAHQPKKGLASLLERNLGIIFWPFLSHKKPVFSTY